MSGMTLTKDQLQLAANTIRMLSADGVEKANSGHPGMPMGAADYAAVLWLKYLSFNPHDPKWLNRDRFVLSNGHGSMLLYSLLHLSGFDVTMDDLKSFRTLGSRTPGHPETFMTAGVEATTGPLGQGIANAVGMAIGEKLLAKRYNMPGADVISHRVFVFAGDGCLQEGVSSEASSLAGHLGLGNLCMFWDDNHISIAGRTELSFTEDVLARYAAYGWNVARCDGHDFDSVDKAISAALKVTDKPSLIACRTLIGKGSPTKEDTEHVHGSPLGADELKKTKEALNWPLEPSFFIPEEVKKLFATRVEELGLTFTKWQEKFAGWKKSHPELATKLDTQTNLKVPADLLDKLVASLPQKQAPIASRKLSQHVLNAASAELNYLIGGSADLEPSTFTLIDSSSDIEKNEFSGLNLRFGIREHGMGAIMNGLSYYGGFVPYGSTFLCFSDYMRPTLRLASLSHLPGLFIYTHDSIFLGEDGPTHQPIEHLNSLRMMPNLWVMRPADGLETAVCYAAALERRDGPCAMIFSRQNLDLIERPANFDRESIRKGAYVAYESGANPHLVFVSTGSEVGLAIAAAKQLGEGVRVVSIPCYELFKKQDIAFRESLIPKGSKKVVVEAASTFGWTEMVGGTSSDTIVIGMTGYGASAPLKPLQEKFGFTPAAVVAKVKEGFSL